MHDDDAHHTPDPDQRQAERSAKRAILFEEALRAATGFMVVVFSVSVVTAFPLVPDWVFPAAIGGVFLSVPAAVYVRVRRAEAQEPRDLTALWGSAIVGMATVGLVFALLLVLAQVTALQTAMTRLAGVLVALGIIAWTRGWHPLRPPEPPPAPGRHDDDPA